MEPEQIQGGSKKLVFGIIVAVILIVVGVTAAIYFQSPTPTGLTINLTSGKVTAFYSSEIDLGIVLTLHNTTDKNITYYGASYAISDNGVYLDSGIFNEHVVFTPGATRSLNETVEISLGDVIRAPPTSAGSWRLQGTATVEVSDANMTQGFDFNFATQ